MGNNEDRLSRVLEYYEGSFPRLRLWSLVVTLFGDAIEPRGRVFRLGSLQKITDKIGIENNALRTAMSRLASDGWLERQRIGRASYYRPSAMASVRNADASKVIYRIEPEGWQGKWFFAIATSSDGFDMATRQNLHDLNFAFCGRKLAIAPETGDKKDPCGMAAVICFIGSQVRGAKIEDLLSAIEFHIDCDEAYRDFSKFCDVIEQNFPDSAGISEIDAMILRLLLVHTWRRIALKDVHWPISLRAKHWPGIKASEDLRTLYRLLVPASERWLSHLDATPEGRLPASNIDLLQRFS